ncbi:hypothetical protein OMW55_05130 [Sphingomonas sp. BN140010]|uniref:Uncharacterized protein n=1 Tax=Sphingomonas arvum TaxID=2992113 RepID=A0ABT3JDS4_9SPHN|nr:hypothetical protein [Sphingomonas sp. BN140010]MCW3797191.1 hypothetical protein [Sphingomonas sp. BN140010]
MTVALPALEHFNREAGPVIHDFNPELTSADLPARMKIRSGKTFEQQGSG